MENTLFTGDVPAETRVSSGFPIATFDFRRVSQKKCKRSVSETGKPRNLLDLNKGIVHAPMDNTIRGVRCWTETLISGKKQPEVYGLRYWLVVTGTWLDYLSIYIGNVIITIDFHIFQSGRYTTNQQYNVCYQTWIGAGTSRTQVQAGVAGRFPQFSQPEQVFSHECPLSITPCDGIIFQGKKRLDK